MNNLVELSNLSIEEFKPAPLEKLRELQNKINIIENEIEDLAKKIYS